MPKANEGDLRDIPLHLRSSMTFHPCETADEVLNVALVGGLKALEARGNGGGSVAPETKPKASRRKRGGDEAIATA